jgi:hypothetical protein
MGLIVVAQLDRSAFVRCNGDLPRFDPVVERMPGRQLSDTCAGVTLTEEEI